MLLGIRPAVTRTQLELRGGGVGGANGWRINHRSMTCHGDYGRGKPDIMYTWNTAQSRNTAGIPVEDRTRPYLYRGEVWRHVHSLPFYNGVQVRLNDLIIPDYYPYNGVSNTRCRPDGINNHYGTAKKYLIFLKNPLSPKT
ncbi:hypothetical protein ACLK11_21855 [Escherichia coli]